MKNREEIENRIKHHEGMIEIYQKDWLSGNQSDKFLIDFIVERRKIIATLNWCLNLK